MIDPLGEFVYAGGNGTQSNNDIGLLQYSINPSTGGLTLVGFTSDDGYDNPFSGYQIPFPLAAAQLH